MAIETRVKDLAEEFGVGTKEIIQHLRDLGVQAKSQMTTIDEETVASLRSTLKGEGSKAEVVQRQTSSGVIVRRRRKSAKPAKAEEKPATETEEPAAEPEEVKAAEEPVAEEKAPRKAKKIAKPAKKPATPQPKASAKIISTPGAPSEEEPESAPEPAEAEPEKTEAKPEPAPEAEALEAKAETADKQEPEAKDEEPAEEEAPEEEAPAETAATEEKPKAAEKEKAAADPGEAKGSKKKKKRKGKKESPQVRVISRPDPAEVAAREREQRVKNLPEPKLSEPREGGAGAPGAPAGPVPPKPDRDAGKKKRRKDRRVVEFAHGDNKTNRKSKQEIEQDRRMRTKGKGRKRGRKQEASADSQVHTQPVKASKRKLRIEDTIRLQDMAKQLGVKAQSVIKVLFGLGIMATINQALDFDTATVVAAEFGYEVENVSFDEQEFLVPTEADKPEDLRPRPPVVTIMGHVDHGKTSLLDAIRSTNITSGEAGGITQHIGAYHVTTERGEIVFLDTPGHEAFTTMRARGAEVTDIVILVVAADDGVMDQTREAIAHSKAAGVPIVVAVNKIDKEDSNPDNVKRELAEFNLVPEEWGGETIFANVSAKQKLGLDELLELVLLQAEVLELKANPDKPARGHIVEAKLDKGRGPVGTVLIQEGTVSQGDAFVCGVFHGKVRAMFDDGGQIIKTAGPAIPVEVQGFDGVPEAGDEFSVVSDDKVARRIAQTRQGKLREKELAGKSKVTLESFLASRPDEEAQTLNLVLKADVQGSLEAVAEALEKLSTEEVKINVVHGAAGAITESDILLASASHAIIIGFNIRPEAKIKEVAERENVEIRFYDIIYKLTNEIKDAMSGMLAPDIKEVYLGQAEVRQTFSVPKVGTVAGCAVSHGKITRNAKVRLLRDGAVIYTGELNSLKRFKDDVKEVQKGYECGMGLTRYNDIKVGDIIEAFEEREVARTI